MADDEQQAPRNRKERRAAAKANGQPLKQAQTKQPKSVADIPMAQPDYSRPTGKTLYDIADERMKAIRDKGQPFDRKYNDGIPRDEEGNVLIPDDEVIGPLGEAIFLTITLSMVHFTLDVLVYQQYAMDMVWSSIFQRTAKMLPVLFVIIFLARTETAKSFDLSRQFLWLSVAVTAGCYMIYVGNTYEYFAVMKQAPPIGTIWIFSVIEMRIPFALASVLIDVGYLLWNGYNFF